MCGQVYLYLGDSAFVISVGDEPPTLPSSFLTLHTYPNPFNASTTIKYSIPSKGRIKLHVYNIRGELIETLTDRVHGSGEFSTVWNGKDSSGREVASGIYIAYLFASGVSISRKLLLLK